MKGIFYDENCGFIRCMIESSDSEGKPRITVVSQGRPVQSLEDYSKAELSTEFRLLCLDGETVTSTTMASVLATAVNNMVSPSGEYIQVCLRKLRQMQLKWEKTPVRLAICVSSETYINNQTRYGFEVRDCDTYDLLGEIIVTRRTLSEMFEFVNALVVGLEEEAEIPVEKLVLDISDKLRKATDERYLDVFDEII